MKTMKLAALALALALPFAAHAHKAWLIPSETVLSGNEPWITVDAAVSNDLFYFNHVPLQLQAVSITGPDGAKVEPQNGTTGKLRSTFDVQLSKPGTYRIAMINAGMGASWEENGAPKRWRGTAETFKTEVPKDAKNLQVSQNAGRVETFVTNGSPTPITATNSGLELVPVTHPNDLFAGEAANFQLLIDGKPAADLKVEIIPGGIRYRDAQNEIAATTDAQGKFSVTWPDAGMYWLQATIQDDKASAPATQRRASYVATLEVLPQ